MAPVARALEGEDAPANTVAALSVAASSEIPQAPANMRACSSPHDPLSCRRPGRGSG